MATLYPNVGAMVVADTIRTSLAAAVLHLFKTVAGGLNVGNVVDDFEEADYSGYLEKTITTWLATYLAPGGGASFQSGTQQFQWATPVGDPVGNAVLGWYLLDSDDNLIAAGTFDAPVSMNAVGDALPLDITLNWARSS